MKQTQSTKEDSNSIQVYSSEISILTQEILDFNEFHHIHVNMSLLIKHLIILELENCAILKPDLTLIEL